MSLQNPSAVEPLVHQFQLLQVSYSFFSEQKSTLGREFTRIVAVSPTQAITKKEKPNYVAVTSHNEVSPN